MIKLLKRNEKAPLSYKDWFALGYLSGYAECSIGKPFDNRFPSDKLSEEERRKAIEEFQRELDERENG